MVFFGEIRTYGVIRTGWRGEEGAGVRGLEASHQTFSLSPWI